MARAECVVLTLRSLQEARDAVLLPKRLHLVVSACEELVRITLMADVPHDLVTGRVEHRVNGDGQLDDPESRTDMTACPGADFYQPLPHRGRQLAQLVARHRPQRCREVEFIE